MFLILFIAGCAEDRDIMILQEGEGIKLSPDPLILAGTISTDLEYGEMFDHTDSGNTITIDDSTSYFNITNLQAGLTNKFTVTNNALIPSIDGTYKFNWAIGFGNAGNNIEYQITLKVNEIIIERCETHRKVGAAGDVGSASGTCLLFLNSDDEVRLGIKNIDGTQNAIMFNVNVNAVRIAD